MFYYAGAATAAGQSYTGALLVSRDGNWPDEGEMNRVEKAFDSCGIKLWELFEVSATHPASGYPCSGQDNVERETALKTLPHPNFCLVPSGHRGDHHIDQTASQDRGANRDSSPLLFSLQVDNTNDEGAPLGLPDDFAVNNERPTLV